MNEWMNEGMNKQINKRANESMDGLTEQINWVVLIEYESTNEWRKNGQTNEWTNK